MVTGVDARPLAVAAAGAWLVTVSIGGYMLRTWVARGGLSLQRATGLGVPPAVIFGHAGAALSGLAVWAGFLAAGWVALAWLGVVLSSAAIALGVGTLTLWTPYPVTVPPPAAPGPPGPDGPRGAAPDGPGDGFTVTDEMLARLLAEPFGARQRARAAAGLSCSRWCRPATASRPWPRSCSRCSRRSAPGDGTARRLTGPMAPPVAGPAGHRAG